MGSRLLIIVYLMYGDYQEEIMGLSQNLNTKGKIILHIQSLNRLLGKNHLKQVNIIVILII